MIDVITVYGDDRIARYTCDSHPCAVGLNEPGGTVYIRYDTGTAPAPDGWEIGPDSKRTTCPRCVKARDDQEQRELGIVFERRYREDQELREERVRREVRVDVYTGASTAVRAVHTPTGLGVFVHEEGWSAQRMKAEAKRLVMALVEAEETA